MSNYSTEKEQIVYATSQSELNLKQLLFVTSQAMMKVVDGGEFDVSKRTVAATKLSEGDTLLSVVTLYDQRNVILQSKEGYFLRFSVEEIPEKKKGAVGVRGMKLGEKDSLEAVYYTEATSEAAIEYKSKHLLLNSIKLAKRDQKGVKIRA